MYTKAFLLWLIKAWERTSKKKRRDGEIGKHKLNEMGALNMKYKKWNKLDKSKRSSCSPVAFKHGCLLETYLELWPKKSNTWAFVFFKKFQVNSNTHLDFKKCLQVFLLNGSFGDIEFYYFSVYQSWYNGIKWVIVT